jgi:multiple sugar transport system substrate-binding protein
MSLETPITVAPAEPAAPRTHTHAFARTRRTILATGGAAWGAALLSACGGTQSGSDSTAAAPAGKPKAGTTIVYWNDQSGQYPELMTRWATSFQQQTGVKVEATGGIAEYENKLSAALAGGTPPDVYRYLQENVPLPAALEQNRLLKLDPYVKRDKYDLADFRKDSITLYQWKGNLLGLPRDYGLQLVYYNTEMFQKAGIQPPPASWEDKTWTFQKFLDSAQALMRSGGAQYAVYVNRGARPWASWVYSNGGSIVKKNADGLSTEFALGEKNAVDAMQFVQDLIYKHKVAPQPGEEASIGAVAQALQNGRIGMRFGNPSDNNQMRTSGIPYDVAPFPIGPSGTRRGVGGGGSGWGIMGPTKQPEEAWAFLQHIASKQAELDEVAIGQTTPARTSVVTGKEYLDPAQPPKNSKVFADGQEYVVRDPVHSKWPDVQRDVVNKILTEQFWTGQASAAQAMKEIKDKGDVYFK